MKGILKGSKPPQSLVGLSIDTHKLGVCEWRREEEEERQDWEEVRMSDLKQCFKEWGGGRSPSMDPLNVLMQAPPCLIPSHNPPLPFPLDASDTENSYPYLKHRFPGDEACFHWAGSFLTSNLGRGSSPRHLLITSDFEKLNVLPIPLAVVTNLGTEPLATFGGDL